MGSNALAALSTRLEDIGQLMAAHAAVGGTNRGRRFYVDALNRASVLLLSGHLEGYLEDLLEEALAAVHPGIEAKPLISRFSNPSIGRINALFAVLGMERPCDHVRWRNASNASVKRNINQLVEERNRIAHGTVGVQAYKDQVTRYRQYVTGFARRFDDLVRQRVAELTGVQPWQRA
jgi:hypothetical protein